MPFINGLIHILAKDHWHVLQGFLESFHLCLGCIALLSTSCSEIAVLSWVLSMLAVVLCFYTSVCCRMAVTLPAVIWSYLCWMTVPFLVAFALSASYDIVAVRLSCRYLLRYCQVCGISG